MESYPLDARKRLGRLLKQRRPQIDRRYRIRRVFANEHGLGDKTIQDVENAYRLNFSEETLSALESAYQLRPGNITRVLNGGELEPAEPATRTPPAEPAAPNLSKAMGDLRHAIEAGEGVLPEEELDLYRAQYRALEQQILLRIRQQRQQQGKTEGTENLRRATGA